VGGWGIALVKKGMKDADSWRVGVEYTQGEGRE